jgi:hypothetical protein
MAMQDLLIWVTHALPVDYFALGYFSIFVDGAVYYLLPLQTSFICFHIHRFFDERLAPNLFPRCGFQFTHQGKWMIFQATPPSLSLEIKGHFDFDPDACKDCTGGCRGYSCVV